MTSPFSTWADLCRRFSGKYGSRPSIAIIGAGTSGIGTAIEMKKRGLDPVLIEARSQPGGIWSLESHFAMYQDLVQNTAPHLTSFEELPGPSPATGSHYSSAEFVAYCADYVEKLGLAKHIYTGCKVTGIKPSVTAQGAYLIVSPADESSESIEHHFEHVVYAGGLYQTPARPPFPDEHLFSGSILHSSQAINTTHLAGKKVLVVGLGNTALDFAAKLVAAGCDVCLSGRGATWIVPRLIDGLPIDVFVQGLQREHGRHYHGKLWEACVSHGAVSHGVSDKAEIDFASQRITVNDDMLVPIRSGPVSIRPSIERFLSANVIRFKDGSTYTAEHVICCTGYVPDQIFSGLAEVDRHLSANVMHPLHERIWAVGAPAVWGGSPPIAKNKGKLIAHAIAEGWNRTQLDTAVLDYSHYEKASVVLPFGLEVVEFVGYAHMVDSVVNTHEQSTPVEASPMYSYA